MTASHDHNRRAWNERVRKRRRFTRPVAPQEMRDPLRTVDSCGWLGPSIAGLRVLCLAAGGGRHALLYAAAGAEVTVVDLSENMLALDRQAAAEYGLEVRTIEASMDDLSALAPAAFDIVIQPVSTCYVRDVLAVYREVARVLVAGGLYISQHKQPASLQADVRPSARGYELVEPYYRQGPLPPVDETRVREQGTLEYLHRWEDLIGGMCRAGLVIEDLIEPLHAQRDAAPGEFGHRSQYVAPYVRIKARRTAAAPEANDGTSRIWLP
jgi:SAM-dependent methyltransferase